MTSNNILAFSLVIVALGASCHRRECTRADAIAALREMSIKQPGMAFQSELEFIENDPRLLAGERFRPDYLIFFSMLKSDIAEVRYGIFWIGGDPPPANVWTLTVCGQNYRGCKMDDPSFGADIDKTINRRFSWFNVYFSVPRDDFINALQRDPSVTLSCSRYPSNLWTFSSEKFVNNLAKMHERCIAKGESEIEYHLRYKQLDFYGRGAGANVQQPGAAQPATKLADKVPPKDQPSTPTSKHAPR